MTELSKSDYLKRYLDNDALGSIKKKKLKKKNKIGKINVQIIDEDIPGWNEDNFDLEQIANCEDAPQIIVEDKKQINTDFSNKEIWKTVGEDDDNNNDNNETDDVNNDSSNNKKSSEQTKQKKSKLSIDFFNGQMEVKYRKKSGSIRDFKRDKEEHDQKMEKQQVFEDLYKDWGKGLKQKGDQQKKVEEYLHEASKPVARYADDADLEHHLKSKQRLDDPMAKYFREKMIQDDFESKKMVKPTYKGQYLPNRYEIPPGYRWDGVDRSNGYEKKWYEAQNKRKSQIIEYRMWSMEDM